MLYLSPRNNFPWNSFLKKYKSISKPLKGALFAAGSCQRLERCLSTQQMGMIKSGATTAILGALIHQTFISLTPNQ